MQNLQPFIDSLQNFAQKRLGFKDPPKLFLKQDEENAKDVFGKTAFYDPSEKSITIFTTGRHPKDILRSIAHELVHHCQNLRGDLSPEKCGDMGVGYAQQNDHMREMERQAFEQGNLCFRDWEDGIKVAMQQENNQLKENKKVVKISKKELKSIIGKLVEARLQEQKSAKDLEKEIADKQERVANITGESEPEKRRKSALTRNIAALKKQLAAAKKEQNSQTATGQEIKKEAVSFVGVKDDDVREQYDHDGDGSSDGLGPGHFDNPIAQDKFNRCLDAAGGDEQAKRACYDFAAQFMDDANQGVGPERYYEPSDSVEELEEGGCVPKARRNDKELEEENTLHEGEPCPNGCNCNQKGLEEGKGEKCPKCSGKGCPHCDGTGYHEEELEEAKDQNKDGKRDFTDVKIARMKASGMSHAEAIKKAEGKSDTKSESKIQTPEQEQKLYESRFNKRNEEIFDKLKKLWTK